MPKKYKYSDKEQNFVNEAPTQYYTQNSMKVPLFNLTTTQKMEIIEKRISKTYLEHFKKFAGLDYDALAKVLSVTRATLINKKGKEKFSNTLSERILALADLYSFGYKMFEDKERFNKWVFVSNQALGGDAPFDYLHNQYGREEIHQLIGRIAYGVYS